MLKVNKEFKILTRLSEITYFLIQTNTSQEINILVKETLSSFN